MKDLFVDIQKWIFFFGMSNGTVHYCRSMQDTVDWNAFSRFKQG